MSGLLQIKFVLVFPSLGCCGSWESRSFPFSGLTTLA